eukprot:COSAG01_NODE_29438_length_637_cov_1.847584_1_plen_29_part_10
MRQVQPTSIRDDDDVGAGGGEREGSPPTR